MNQQNPSTTFDEYLRLFVQSKLSRLDAEEELRFEALTESLADLGSFEDLRSQHDDLDRSLAEIEDYREATRYSPFWSDQGVGSSKAMPVRWEARHQIAGAASAMRQALEETYQKLILAFLPEDYVRLVNDRQIPDLKPLMQKKYPEFIWLKAHPEVWEWFRSLLNPDDVDLLRTDLTGTNATDRLDLDSLEMLEVKMMLEETLGLDEQDLPEMGGTYGDLAKLVKWLDERRQ